MSNLNIAVTDSLWRVVSQASDPQREGFVLVREVPKVHASYTDTLVVALRANLTYTSPIADGKRYGGTFVQTLLNPTVDAEEAISLRQTLTKVTAVAPDASSHVTQLDGDPQHVGFKVKRAWYNINPASSDTLITAKRAILTYANPATAEGTFTGDFVASAVGSGVEEDRTATIKQTLTKAKSTTDSSDADLLSLEGDPAVAGTKVNRAWHYLYPPVVDTLFATLNGTKVYNSGILVDGEKYSGTFTVNNVRPVKTDDGTIRMEQTLIKTLTVGNLGDLTNPIIEREKEIWHPFGEGTGTHWRLVYKYPNLSTTSDTKLMAFTDTQLESKAGDAWEYVDRKTITEEDNTLSFFILYRKVARIDWTATSYQTPDQILREFTGTKREIKRKRWFGIDRNDHASVLIDLENLAHADTNFSILGTEYEDRDDGSKDYTWRQVKRLNDSRTDSRFENPQGIEHTAVKVKHYNYENYPIASLPADPSVPSGYKAIETQISLGEKGYFDKVVFHAKASPSNVVDVSNIPTGSELVQERNPMGHTDLDSASRGQTHLYDRVPLADAADAVQALKATSDSQWVVTSAGYTDLGDGSARITRSREKINEAGLYFIEEIQAPVGSQNASARREWPRITDTKANVLLDSGGLAVSDFTYRGISYTHAGRSRIYLEDGLSTVRQVGMVPGGGRAGYGDGVSDYTDTRFERYWFKDSASHWEALVGIKESKSFKVCDSFAHQSTCSSRMPKQGTVKTIKKNWHRGYKVTWHLQD